MYFFACKKGERMIGNKIKELREKNEMSQEMLAKEANLSFRTIQRIEANKGFNFSSLQKIAKVFNVNIEELIKK